jgi:hypothetical protein
VASARAAGAEWVTGAGLKAVLDLDWEHPVARQRAVERVLEVRDAVEIPRSEKLTLEQHIANQALTSVACVSSMSIVV